MGSEQAAGSSPSCFGFMHSNYQSCAVSSTHRALAHTQKGSVLQTGSSGVQEPPGSAWKVSGSTGRPLPVSQPLGTIITTSIPGLQEGQDVVGGNMFLIMWRWLTHSTSFLILKSWSYQIKKWVSRTLRDVALQVRTGTPHAHFPVPQGTAPYQQGCTASQHLYLCPLL